MGKLVSDRERKLQKKLIPVNILVCIIALVAAITLFMTPILKIDFGKILHDKGVMEFVDEKIDEVLEEQLKDEEQTVDYAPVVAKIVKNVLGNAEGEISVSAMSSLKIFMGSGNKADMVMDEMFFGKDALVTRLIDSVVNSVADLFETDEGKKIIEDAAVLAFANALYKDMDNNGENSQKFTDEKVKDLTEIMRGLSDITDGDVTVVANKFVDEVDKILGDDIHINEDNRQAIVDEIQNLYDTTVENLKEGETVSIESLICVAVSDNLDLSSLNLGDLIGNLFGEDDNTDNEGSVHKAIVEGESEGQVEEGNTEEGEEKPADGESTPEEGGQTPADGEGQKIVTNYNDLLAELGFGEEEKEDLKVKLKDALNDQVKKYVNENGVDSYMEYYQYEFIGMLVFIVPWLILFLFSFFHLLAKNKRFTMWYVKLICWIPALIWLVLTLIPVVATKVGVLNEIWNGEQGKLIQGIFNGISSMTWISGLCYVLLWLISIFWAFPIKHKIRKERKNPEVKDVEYDDDDYDDFGY